MHNLLPAEHKKRLRNMYRNRLGVVACVVAGVTVVLCIVTLFPALVHVSVELSVARAEHERLLTARSENVGEQEPRIILTRGKHLVALLHNLEERVHVTAVVNEALEAQPRGVTVTGFSYSHDDLTLRLEGYADRRASLVSYTNTLEANPRFAATMLPISDLAESADIGFRLTLTLAGGTDTADE